MSNRYSDSRLIDDKTIAMMNPTDRQALGVLTPDERRHKGEAVVERYLQRLCEQELSRRRISYMHLSFRAREKIGWPDLTFCLHGRFVAVELKTARGTVSKEQVAILADLERNGALTRVIRSFEDFRDLLEVQP